MAVTSVYIIECAGYCKIGVAKNPNSRLKSINTATPIKASLYAHRERSRHTRRGMELLQVECGACGWKGKRKPGKLVFCPACGSCAAFQPQTNDSAPLTPPSQQVPDCPHGGRQARRVQRHCRISDVIHQALAAFFLSPASPIIHHRHSA